MVFEKLQQTKKFTFIWLLFYSELFTIYIEKKYLPELNKKIKRSKVININHSRYKTTQNNIKKTQDMKNKDKILLKTNYCSSKKTSMNMSLKCSKYQNYSLTNKPHILTVDFNQNN